MDDTYENMLCHGLNRRRTCTPSHFDDVGADVRRSGQFTDLADEDVNPTEGDPVPVLDSIGVGIPSCIVDVELAATTLRHPAHSVSLKSIEAALQELKTIVRWPHGGRQLSWVCHGRCPCERT